MNPVYRLIPVGLLALMLLLALEDLPQDQGEPNPEATYTDEYYLENGQNETGSNNIVTSVLFDYRGLDTLLEATVLFTAVASIGALLHVTLNRDDRYKEYEPIERSQSPTEEGRAPYLSEQLRGGEQ